MSDTDAQNAAEHLAGVINLLKQNAELYKSLEWFFNRFEDPIITSKDAYGQASQQSWCRACDAWRYPEGEGPPPHYGKEVIHHSDCPWLVAKDLLEKLKS